MMRTEAARQPPYTEQECPKRAPGRQQLNPLLGQPKVIGNYHGAPRQVCPSLPMAGGKEAWDEPLLRVPARLWSSGFNGDPNKLRPQSVVADERRLARTSDSARDSA